MNKWEEIKKKKRRGNEEKKEKRKIPLIRLSTMERRDSFTDFHFYKLDSAAKSFQ